MCHRIIFALIVSLLQFQEGSGRQCYHCNDIDVDDNIPDCSEDINGTARLKECGDLACAKVTFYVSGQHDDPDRWATIRDCEDSEDMLGGIEVCSDRQKESEDGCAGDEDRGINGVLVSNINACCCRGELCNSGQLVEITRWIFPLLLFVLVINL